MPKGSRASLILSISPVAAASEASPATKNQISARSDSAEELAALKADIDKGLADVAAGRVKDFDTDRIIARGRKLLADRSPIA